MIIESRNKLHNLIEKFVVYPSIADDHTKLDITGFPHQGIVVTEVPLDNEECALMAHLSNSTTFSSILRKFAQTGYLLGRTPPK